MIDVDVWKDLHELYPKNPKIIEHIVNQLEYRVSRQQTRIESMQRKLDRYKKYARIKYRKEQKQAEERQDTAQCLFDQSVPVTNAVYKTLESRRNRKMTRLTKEQAAIIGAYTGFLCGEFSDLHKKIEEIMGRPVWTHEMGSEKFTEELREKTKPLFFSILPVDYDNGETK